jgi:hypothetical protein
MALSGLVELSVTCLFVAVIWLAGDVVYFKVADYYMQVRRAPPGNRLRRLAKRGGEKRVFETERLG